MSWSLSESGGSLSLAAVSPTCGPGLSGARGRKPTRAVRCVGYAGVSWAGRAAVRFSFLFLFSIIFS
jgi:hypothetical protein